ncbi:MAG: tetratricopeptide repeat protein [Acidobacteriota bacterium]|nr:tetratricopeptide repeat protein [Acidobacteriota bacterium]
MRGLFPALFVVALRSQAADMEPQVAARIATARAAVAESPAAGETWGELAMVLQAHELQNEAYEIYLEAMQRAPADYRWPYLAALTGRPPDAALELLAKAHARGPDDVSLTLNFAGALTRAGELNQARGVYMKARDTESSREHAQLGLARIMLLQGQVVDALELLEVSWLGTSLNADLYRLLAQARRLVGHAAGARRAAWRARSYGPGRRRVSDVVDQMRGHGVSVGALLDRGRRLSDRGEHQGARALFEAASRWDTSGEAEIDLGQVVLAQGRPREALAHFQAVLEQAPDNPDLQVGLADAWLQLGDETAAESALAAALGRRSDHPGARRALGRLRNRQERFQDAIEHLEMALATEPTRYLAYADLADAFSGLESFREALEARRKLAILAPDQLSNLKSLVRLEIGRDELGAATKTLRQIHERQPEELWSAFNLAMLLATSTPVSEADAVQSLNLALELYRARRHDAACADLLGAAYAVNGRFGDATRVALRARELAKGDAALSAAIEDHLAHYAQQQRVTVPRLR